MNIDFKTAVISCFFGFVTLILLLGLIPALAHFVYRKGASFSRRVVAPIGTGFVAGLVLILPVVLTDVLLGVAGLFFIVRFWLRARRTKHDVA